MKMVSHINFVLITVIVAIIAQTAHGLTCYECDSQGTTNCGEYFRTDGIEKRDCSKGLNPIKNATGCIKRTYEVKGVRAYKRECYSGDLREKRACEEFLSQTNNPYAAERIMDCQVCADNLCNVSNEITVMSMGLFLATLFARNLF